MIRTYRNEMSIYQNIEKKIKNVKETKLVREAEIFLNRDLNEEEKNYLIENPQYLKDMYQEKLAGVQLQNAVRYLEERHKDIKKILTSVMELHKMVIELNALVKLQGEMMDNIVENVNKAKKMFEDKLPELFEVIIYHLLIKIQIAKQEGISISQIEDNDTDIQENIPISEFTNLINSGSNQIKYIESQTNKLISINNKLIYCSKDEQKGLYQQIYYVTDNISQSRNKINQIIKILKEELDSSSEGNHDKKVKKEETELRIEEN